MKQGPKAPCKGCSDRCADPNCHMTCDRYLAFRNERDAANSKRLMESKLMAPIRRCEPI